jgi:hypothetical protein
MNATEILKTIKPGKNYPADVEVIEKNGMKVKFCMNSFFVGMYCAIYVNGNLASQTGDYDNKKFCTDLKKDLTKAIARGAIVEISSIRSITSEMPL